MPTRLLRTGGDNFWMWTGAVAGVILAYLTVLILIIVSGVCESASIHEKSQQTTNILGWDAQFVSERFCQCYESDARWKRWLPAISVLSFPAVVVLLILLNEQYRRHAQQSTWVMTLRLSNPSCFVLGVACCVFYGMLVFNTHRPTCIDIDTCFKGTRSDTDLHFTSTALFFLCFFFLWSVVLLDNMITDYTAYNGKLRLLHSILFFAFLLQLCLFVWFGSDYIRNVGDTHQQAIQMEYVIFITLMLQCAFCLVCVLLYHNAELDYKAQQETSQEQMQPAIQYISLNTNIL
jgi:hypothetical protein